MATSKEKSDKHFPVWGHKFSTLFSNPKKYCSYVKNGQVVADLGCGPGFYTMELADSVGNEGKIYTVDSDEKAIQALEKKLEKGSYHNIETHASSASDLKFIKDGSVDFVLANGLLCSIAPQQLESAGRKPHQPHVGNGDQRMRIVQRLPSCPPPVAEGTGRLF